MKQLSKIVNLTNIEYELFQNDKGEFPHSITLVISENPSDIVGTVISRMSEVFLEYDKEYPNELTVIIRSAETIADHEDKTYTVITPDTLSLIMDYKKGCSLITLELGTSLENFTVH